MLTMGSFADVIYGWSSEAESNECSDATTAQKESKRGKGGGGGTLGRDGLSNDASYHRCIGTSKNYSLPPIFCPQLMQAVNASMTWSVSLPRGAWQLRCKLNAAQGARKNFFTGAFYKINNSPHGWLPLIRNRSQQNERDKSCRQIPSRKVVTWTLG